MLIKCARVNPGVTAGADTAVTAVIGARWCAPPPTVLDRAQTRSLLRLGASAD